MFITNLSFCHCLKYMCRCYQVPRPNSRWQTRAWYWSTSSWHCSRNCLWLLCRISRNVAYCILGIVWSRYPSESSSSRRLRCAYVMWRDFMIWQKRAILNVLFYLSRFRLINEGGKSVFVKFHWKPLQGLSNLLWVNLSISDSQI